MRSEQTSCARRGPISRLALAWPQNNTVFGNKLSEFLLGFLCLVTIVGNTNEDIHNILRKINNASPFSQILQLGLRNTPVERLGSIRSTTKRLSAFSGSIKQKEILKEDFTCFTQNSWKLVFSLKEKDSDRTMAVGTEETIPLTTLPTSSGHGGSNAFRQYNTYTSDLSASAPPSTCDGSVVDDNDDDDDHGHATTTFQTFVHLFKGYLGAGCLSLPWAVSQLGLFWGALSIVLVSIWSSYNCWTVVQLKRYIEAKEGGANQALSFLNNNINTNTDYVISSKASDSAASSVGPSSVTSTNTQMTYPDVGHWAYGTKFGYFVKIALCTQQLAICTVFISFVGENLLAVLQYYGCTSPFLASHAGVMTVIMPAIIALSLIPNLKLLSPVMAAGTLFLGICFVAIGIIVAQEWEYRPESPPVINPPQVPLATCAILYSYEGINLILPLESAMKEPQHFAKAFGGAMTCVAIVLSGMAIICVLTFGYVDSGSVTAFLLEAYKDDDNIVGWLMIANTAVSISVLVTYPLQLFPAIELLAPSISKYLFCNSGSGCCKGNSDDDDDDDDDLSGFDFEPLPPLQEHVAADWGDDDLMEFHQYEDDNALGNSSSKLSTGGDDDEVVDLTKLNDKDNSDAGSIARSALTSVRSILPKMTMPGDSILVRLILVLLTFLIAVAVPNVQALISLAGAVAGSSSALLIPPFLELAWIQDTELDATATSTTTNTNTDTDTNTTSETKSGFRWKGCWSNGGSFLNRLKCYILLGLGLLFFAIGTYASLSDIISIYMGEE